MYKVICSGYAAANRKKTQWLTQLPKAVILTKNKKDSTNYLWNKRKLASPKVPCHNNEKNQKSCQMQCLINQSQKVAPHPKYPALPKYQKPPPSSNHRPNHKHNQSLNHKPLDPVPQGKLKKKSNQMTDHKLVRQVRWARCRCAHQLLTKEDHQAMWAREAREAQVSNR